MCAQSVQCTRSHNFFRHSQEEEHRPVTAPYGCCVCSSYCSLRWRCAMCNVHAHTKTRNSIDSRFVVLSQPVSLTSTQFTPFMPVKKSDAYGRFTCETDQRNIYCLHVQRVQIRVMCARLRQYASIKIASCRTHRERSIPTASVQVYSLMCRKLSMPNMGAPRRCLLIPNGIPLRWKTVKFVRFFR